MGRGGSDVHWAIVAISIITVIPTPIYMTKESVCAVCCKWPMVLLASSPLHLPLLPHPFCYFYYGYESKESNGGSWTD